MAPLARRRSILGGACLVDGHHRAGTAAAGECPLLQGRITPEENARRVGRPTGARRAEDTRPATTLQGPDSEPSSGSLIPTTSNTVFRHGRAGKNGRPRVPVAEQRQKARSRNRAYRARLERPHVFQEG
jgi:hypothetical protein